jgi:uncharacterized protein YjbJ (UPF0337 family)
MNSDQIQGKWKQLSGSFREKFGRFTNDDVAKMNGQREHIIGKLQEKYGDTKEEAERRFNEWSSSLKDADEKATRTSAAGASPKH